MISRQMKYEQITWMCHPAAVVSLSFVLRKLKSFLFIYTHSVCDLVIYSIFKLSFVYTLRHLSTYHIPNKHQTPGHIFFVTHIKTC